jgi:hypothetical protein
MLFLTALILSLQDDDARPQALRELDVARQELQILQLLNEVNLKAEQIENILECVDEANKIMKSFAEDNRVILADLAKALADAKSTLERGEALSEDARQSIAEIDRSIRERSREMQTQLQPLGEKIRGALEERQLRRLLMFGKPDPMRNELRKGLNQIRMISDEDFETKIPQAIGDRVQKLGGLSQEEMDAERDRIIGILKEARVVSDEDFAKKTEEYVDKILSEGKMGEAIKKATPQGSDADKQLGKFLMSSRVTELLRKRLELLKSK